MTNLIGAHPRMVYGTISVQVISGNFLRDKAAEKFRARCSNRAMYPASQTESKAALQNRYGSYINLNRTG